MANELTPEKIDEITRIHLGGMRKGSLQMYRDFAHAVLAAADEARAAAAPFDEVALRDAFAEALTSVYVCGRVWEAWSVGTMSREDFSPAGECDEVLDGLVDAARARLAAPAVPATVQPQMVRRDLWQREVDAAEHLRGVAKGWHEQAVALGFDGVAEALDSLAAPAVAAAPARMEVQPVADRDCGNCRHASIGADEWPCRSCGFERGNGPFDKWEPRSLGVIDAAAATGEATCSVFEAPPMPKMPSICNGMSKEDLWGYAGLVGQRTMPASPRAPLVSTSDRQAYAYACELACSLHRKHYSEVTQWAGPMEDLYGVLSQIDNMTTGLARRDEAPSTAAVAPGAEQATPNSLTEAQLAALTEGSRRRYLSARQATATPPAPSPQQISDYLAGLDAIQREVVEREARKLAAPVAADRVPSDAAMLDFMERKRVSLIPEYEGPWDAEVYIEEGEPLACFSGNTPREALKAAMDGIGGQASEARSLQHVCGAQGFGYEATDRCAACEAERASEGERDAG